MNDTWEVIGIALVGAFIGAALLLTIIGGDNDGR